MPWLEEKERQVRIPVLLHSRTGEMFLQGKWREGHRKEVSAREHEVEACHSEKQENKKATKISRLWKEIQGQGRRNLGERNSRATSNRKTHRNPNMISKTYVIGILESNTVIYSNGTDSAERGVLYCTCRMHTYVWKHGSPIESIWVKIKRASLV